MLKIKPFRKGEPRGLGKLVAEPASELVNFYINDATFYEEERLARTYDVEWNKKWCGFFTLSSYSLKLDKAERGINEVLERKGIPLTPPAILLGQLFLCESHREQGIGTLILQNVVTIALKSPAACRLVVIDLDHENVRGFYQKHGWIPAPQTSSKMYLDLQLFSRIRRILKKENPNILEKDELKEFALVQAALPIQSRLF